MPDTTRQRDPSGSDARASLSGITQGQMIGPYLLDRLLGRGGLGEVWLAQRADGEFRPEVAIKLIPGHRLNDAEIARRFDRERRILLKLDHPDIARLLDAGRLRSGVPYLVMEYVEGRSLNLAASTMSLADRLRLFIRVCRAVQNAHSRLVIHRDIKPSNILVTETGNPKLLDFNTAKLLEADEDPELTQLVAPMTPRYASPEQLRGEDLGTASDQYSLGVVLYELVAEDSPYGVTDLSGYQLERRISESMPAAPSHAGRGDRSLDAIIARAMHREPGRRYRSVDALGDDIEAWLDRRPIKAKPVGRFERFALMARRNPLASALVGGLTALTLGATTLFYWQLQEAREERDVSLTVTSFLETLFEAVDPGSTTFTGDDLFRVLDDRSITLRSNLPEDSRVAARLLDTLGAVQSNLGRWEEAAALFEASWSEEENLETLVRWANARLETGDTERATELFERAHLQRQAMTPAMQAFHGASYAQLKVMQDDLTAAESLASEAARVAPNGSVDQVYATDTYGQVLFYTGQVTRAIEVGEQALEMAIRFYGDPHMQVATSRNNLAIFLGRAGRGAKALALLEQATVDFAQIFGEDDAQMATTYSSLGNRRSQQGQFGAALEVLDLASAVTRQHFGDADPLIGLNDGYRGETFLRMGELQSAAEAFDLALGALVDHRRYRHRVWPSAIANQVLQGEFDPEALGLARAIAEFEAAYSDDHPWRLRLLELEALVALEQEAVDHA
ncbi:MAG: serine/threonine-protein kinase, partial [Pseudomonadota bacterium]